jgi:phenylalanyl-tRNA synthetase alpha chain
MTFEEESKKIRDSFFEQMQKVCDSKGLEEIKIQFLGRKGKLQELMQELKKFPKENLPVFGKLINDLKEEITLQLESAQNKISANEQENRLQKEKIDITLPGKRRFMGNKHPVTLMMDRVIDVLVGMGFSVEYGPEMESDFYNFEALNFAADHPARDMQDTFYITDKMLLRTQTSNVQVRVMEKNSPPIRVIAPGRCFRNETVSARSHVFFHQVEAFYVDEKVTFSDLLATLDEFWTKLFSKEVKTRYRPSYFPFVEPGLEADISCTMCGGKGCRLCKYTGWLEVTGAGMIHPEVLKAGGIDSEKYSGYAWGLGIERLAMLFYDIDDIRHFTQNDIRFLEQITS